MTGEWIPYGDGTDPRIPAHLRSNAPRQQCGRCHRWTVATSEFDQIDMMTQPDGGPCGGRFSDGKVR
jgi:hypothetical protein